jgi:hypothetical protein
LVVPNGAVIATEITAAGKLQRAAHRAGTKMTLDEAIAAVREINEDDEQAGEAT